MSEAENKSMLESILDSFLRAYGFSPLYEKPPRMTVHTANRSFTGRIDIDQKKGITLVTIETGDGEIGVPYDSIEYFEHAEQEDEDEKAEAR